MYANSQHGPQKCKTITAFYQDYKSKKHLILNRIGEIIKLKTFRRA